MFRANAGLINKYNKRGQPGSEKAIKAWLESLGIGTKERDKVQKNGRRYYVASAEFKRIRAEQTKERGPMKPEYGYSEIREVKSMSQIMKYK